MESPWHYIDNQFINATKENFKKAMQLSSYHNSFLQDRMVEDPADLDWATLYNRYNPFHIDYSAKFLAWKNADGHQQGQTVGLDQLLTLLVSRVDTWESQVKALPGFEKGSANHQALFPYGRRPFNKGSKDARVTAVANLATSMNNFPMLGPVMALVTVFHTQLLAARSAQTGSIGNTKYKSKAVEDSRIAVMTEQYRDVGFLINKLAQSPDYIGPFFNLNVLRESNQVIFTGTLDPSETEPVLIHTFVADDELQLEIKGDPATPAGTMVQFYLAPVAGGTTGTAVNVEINAAPLSITAAAFGITDYGTHRFLTAVNTNGVELHYVVELL